MRYAAQKGTKDILPAEIYKWHKAERVFADVCHDFGYEEIRIPTFEQTDLFQRGVGDTTDVVTKEMYTFNDKGGRSITLRPEGTAGVVRSYIENGMASLPSPVRMFYSITAFRYEKMQKGRMREFHQFGLEAFGSEGPAIDAEIISVVDIFFKKIGLKNIKLCINSIGCPSCRNKYNEMLKDYFRPHVSTMCEDCQARFEKNPLRMIDCKIDGGKEVVQNAPRLIDYLCDDCKTHFEALKNKLDVIGIRYEIDPNIVRGLDYYTRTVFEFVSENVGTQGTICGGGRYDGLVENCGGAPTPGIGFAMGVERLLLEAEAQGIEFEKNDSVKIYFAGMSDAANEEIAKICYELRSNGIGCETDLMNRSFKAQMKYAGKSGIPYLAVIGDDELNTGKVNIKKMDDGSQTEVELDKIIVFLKR
ncbi:histidyl-tRNA synthetase [Ruminococcaceae bacterium YRB3002]|nr:histidyl-tRNA synthetase [Ruminococcaceae bacterium YRB3002]